MTDDTERTRRCQAALAAEAAEALVLFPGPNLRYLTGLSVDPSERHFLFVVPADGTPTMLVPAMAESSVRRESWIEAVRTHDDDDDPQETLQDLFTDLGIGGDRVLLDDHLWATFVLDLRAVLPDATFGLASDVLADLRIRKDDAEIAAMHDAAAITDEVCTALRDDPTAVIGTAETELARLIDDRQRDIGGEGPSFPTIVAAGPNGAAPHHEPGARRIQAGDPVVLDFGTIVDGYASDQTRTMVFDAEPPTDFEAVFDAVREAHDAGVDAVEPGVPCEAVDRATRDVIEERGFGDVFLHRTGHGVGLEIHEPPYIVAGNDRPLEPGMVFSVEPGVYLDGAFGVRIEDLVVVTDDGAERLNDSPHEWRVEPR